MSIRTFAQYLKNVCIQICKNTKNHTES